jgi:GDP-L-fucose synthase
METILITGGSGLVGSAINSIKNIYNNKFNFIFMSSKECDLTDYQKTLEYFTLIKPDYIIHLAANVGGLFKNMKQKVDMFEINIIINHNVLKAAHIIGVKKLISCLSTCIFPDNTLYPISESMLHQGPPHTSNDAYAYAKRMLEIHSIAYQEQYNDNFICIIPTNIYGSYDNFNLEDAHVIPALIHKCYLAKKENKPFIVAGTGMPLRQFIYSQDLAQLIMIILTNYHERDTIILSVGEEDEVSIKDIATIIANKFNYSENLIFDPSKPDGQFKKTANNSKLIHFLNKESINYKFTNISSGINDTIDWFINNYNECRK